MSNGALWVLVVLLVIAVPMSAVLIAVDHGVGDLRAVAKAAAWAFLWPVFVVLLAWLAVGEYAETLGRKHARRQPGASE